MQPLPRSVLAPNASPMTLDGTRTWIVGRDRVAIIDPGSAAEAHLAAIAAEVRAATHRVILVTHDHPDHSTGAPELSRRLDAPVWRLGDGLLDGGTVPTDDGELVTLATPGHAPDHVSFHWPAAAAVFCGDLMMGGLDTAVVAAPEGSVAHYLASLARLRALRPGVIYPAHGPPFKDPITAIDRYVRHRSEREAQVLEAIAAGAADRAGIVQHVYGDGLDVRLQEFAMAAVAAYLAHLAETGRLPEDFA